MAKEEFAENPAGKIAPQSPSDIVDTYKPDSEKHMTDVLRKSLTQTGPATYSKGKR
jgi:hypothetical protein